MPGQRKVPAAKRLKRAVKRALLRAGVDVRRARAFGGYGAFEDQHRLLRAGAPEVDEPTLLDVGAHVGDVTARYRRMFPQARIHSFEPARRAFDLLDQRFAGDDRTRAYPLALGDRCGTAQLHLNRDEVTNSLLASSAAVSEPVLADRMATLEEVDVALLTLDEWAQDRGVDQIHLLKMDVQGAELEVLRGARRKLSARQIWMIYSEVTFAPLYEGQAFFWDVAGWLASYGFECFNLYNCKTGGRGQLTWGDAIFLGPRMLGTADSDPRRGAESEATNRK